MNKIKNNLLLIFENYNVSVYDMRYRYEVIIIYKDFFVVKHPLFAINMEILEMIQDTQKQILEKEKK